MTVNVTASSSPIEVAASGTTVDVSVPAAGSVSVEVASGPAGPAGATGSSGVVAVSAPITNSGTSTSAQLGLSVGSGLQVAGGSLTIGNTVALKSDITAAAPKLVVRATVAESFLTTPSEDTTIVFDSEQVDTENAYNPASGQFTVPAGMQGVYLAYVYFLAGGSLTPGETQAELKLKASISGITKLDAGATVADAGVFLRFAGSVPIVLAAGDVVTVAVFCDLETTVEPGSAFALYRL